MSASWGVVVYMRGAEWRVIPIGNVVIPYCTKPW